MIAYGIVVVCVSDFGCWE